ncbi:MAG: dihydrolipoamide acetyltransferase family protein [Actinomycetota bacterium]
MSSEIFRLPDVGEGLTEAEILRWWVQPGDQVSVNQTICEIETAKAAVELPCPFAGTIDAIHVEVGQIVAVGAPIITIAVQTSEPVLVGYGVKGASASQPTRRARVTDGSAAVTGARTRIKPVVRKLARDNGLDVSQLTGSGPHGEVTRADVLAALGTEPALPSVSPDEPGDRIPVRGVHRAMAEAMVQSKFTAPHVTEWVDVDMSRAMQIVQRLRENPAHAALRITPLALVAMGWIRAAQRFPRINSTWVDTTDGADIIVHRSVHLGLAADTPRGLLVPVVKNAGGMTIVELARMIQQVIDVAREGRSSPTDLTGGTITLTNVGVFGVDGGTPILTPGQSAILAMGRILDRPWVVNGEIAVRPILQLTLSFDHRVIDGALGSRALASVAEFLSDPAMELLFDPTV